MLLQERVSTATQVPLGQGSYQHLIKASSRPRSDSIHLMLLICFFINRADRVSTIIASLTHGPVAWYQHIGDWDMTD